MSIPTTKRLNLLDSCNTNIKRVSDMHVWHLQGAKKVKAQGMGVHKPEEIIEFGQNDLKVLSDMLADKPFFFGDEPTTVSMTGPFWWVYVRICLADSLLHVACLCVAVGCCGICQPGADILHWQRSAVLSTGLHAGELPQSGGTCQQDEGDVRDSH